MINIGEISKPSVPPKTGSTNKRAKKIESTEPIDATRKVNATTRDDQSKQAKQQKEKKPTVEEAIKQTKSDNVDDSRNKDNKIKHIDISV